MYDSQVTLSSLRRWFIRRTLEEFQSLDRQLHTCVYDRRYSQLPVIHQLENIQNNGKVGSVRLASDLGMPLSYTGAGDQMADILKIVSGEIDSLSF